MAFLDSDISKIHEYNILLSNQRMEALVTNVGSAEVRDYKRVDIDESVLKLFLEAVKGQAVSLGLASAKISPDRQAKAQGPSGNTVDVRQEMVYINDTATSQRFSMHTLSKSFKTMHKVLE
jgi:flagellar basal body rod protein FlgB